MSGVVTSNERRRPGARKDMVECGDGGECVMRREGLVLGARERGRRCIWVVDVVSELLYAGEAQLRRKLPVLQMWRASDGDEVTGRGCFSSVLRRTPSAGPWMASLLQAPCPCFCPLLHSKPPWSLASISLLSN